MSVRENIYANFFIFIVQNAKARKVENGGLSSEDDDEGPNAPDAGCPIRIANSLYCEKKRKRSEFASLRIAFWHWGFASLRFRFLIRKKNRFRFAFAIGFWPELDTLPDVDEDVILTTILILIGLVFVLFLIIKVIPAFKRDNSNQWNKEEVSIRMLGFESKTDR